LKNLPEFDALFRQKSNISSKKGINFVGSNLVSLLKIFNGRQVA
jgi:hypothetical protein